VLVLAATAPACLLAQTNWDAVPIRTTPIRGRVTLLAAAGGNLAVFTGTDGVLVVDADYAELTDRILAAIAELEESTSASAAPSPGTPAAPDGASATADPGRSTSAASAGAATLSGADKAAPMSVVRYLVNSHWHFDHVGGNEGFARAGATIIAHERVRRLMAEDRVMAALDGRRVPAAPPAALPVLTFNDRLNLELNGDLVHLVHMAAAHTDGDVIVHFRDADVIHMGDLFFNGMYPFIDVDFGGNIAGMVRAVEEVLDHTPPTTLFIPGHGPLAGRSDLERYRDMLATVRDRVQEMIARGMGRAEVQAAKPTADFDPAWAGEGSFLTPDVWVGLVYDGLVRGGAGVPASR
jgi:glyoxylase-like metal-dependent hydrolase (beta-lactamase superfamily II)